MPEGDRKGRSFLKPCRSTSAIWRLTTFQDKPFHVFFCLFEPPTPSQPHKRPPFCRFGDKTRAIRQDKSCFSPTLHLCSPWLPAPASHQGQALPRVLGQGDFAPAPPPPALAKLTPVSTRWISPANKRALWLPLNTDKMELLDELPLPSVGPVSFPLSPAKLHNRLVCAPASTSSPCPSLLSPLLFGF